MMKVLIAEDNQPLQVLAEDLMSMWGYDFDLANNGQEAVEYAQKNEGKYDICLMDVEMPIMNGIKATEIIRQKLNYFPIMAVSGAHQYRDECLEIGMDYFLEKPYSSKKLFDKLDELTVKVVKITRELNQISLGVVMPMNSGELKELRELDKKGLTKFSLINTDHKFIVHKNLQNKISHDFIAKEKKLSEFLDRSPDGPGIIHLYASNLDANKRHILPEVLEELSQKKDTDLKNYTTKAAYSKKENPE